MADTRHTTTVDIKVDDREIVRLADELNRTFTTNSLETFNKMMERQSTVLATLIKQQEQLRRGMEKTGSAGRDGGSGRGGSGGGGGGGHGGDGHGGGGEPSWWNRVSATGVGTYLGHKAEHIGHGVAGFPGAAAGGGFTKAAAHAMPVGGEFVSGTMEAAEKYHSMAMANLNARMGAFGAAGISGESFKAMGKWGANIGIDPDAMPGMMEAAARQTGLSGESLMGAAPGVIRAQRFLGVNNAGVVAGAAGAAGGEVSAQRSNALLAQTIGTAVASGVQESRLDEYFQGVAGFVEQMRNRGIPIEPESLNTMVAGFGSIHAKSLSGMAGLNAATTLAGGVVGAMRGTGISSAILMEITGVAHGKNPFKAMREVEEDPAGTVQLMINHIRGMKTGDEDIDGELLKQGLGGIGNLSNTQAYDLMRGAINVDDVFSGTAAEATGKAGRALLNKREGLAGDMTKDLKMEAGIKQQGIALGQSESVVHLVHHLEKLDQEIATAVLPAMAHFVDSLLSYAEDFARAHPPAKVLGDAAKKLEDAIQPVEDVVDDFAATPLGGFLGVPTIGNSGNAAQAGYTYEDAQLWQENERDKNKSNPESEDFDPEFVKGSPILERQDMSRFEPGYMPPLTGDKAQDDIIQGAARLAQGLRDAAESRKKWDFIIQEGGGTGGK